MACRERARGPDSYTNGPRKSAICCCATFCWSASSSTTTMSSFRISRASFNCSLSNSPSTSGKQPSKLSTQNVLYIPLHFRIIDTFQNVGFRVYHSCLSFMFEFIYACCRVHMLHLQSSTDHDVGLVSFRNLKKGVVNYV